MQRGTSSDELYREQSVKEAQSFLLRYMSRGVCVCLSVYILTYIEKS